MSDYSWEVRANDGYVAVLDDGLTACKVPFAICNRASRGQAVAAAKRIVQCFESVEAAQNALNEAQAELDSEMEAAGAE